VIPSSGARLRIALDATPLLGNRTGVAEVVAGFLGELAVRPEVDLHAYALTWRGRHDLASQLPPGVTAATAAIPARAVRACWMRSDHPRIERWSGSVDVAHGTNFVPPPARVPVVVTLHDLTFVKFPELCTADALQYPTLIRRALARGAVVHTISDFVAGEVRDEFGLAPDRVVRVYPGVPSARGGNAHDGRRIAGADRYLLAVGTIEPRKNLPVLVAAFDQVATTDPDLVLVVAGQNGWGTAEFDAACARASSRARIRRLGYVSTANRRDLLAGSQLLAYPSRYEGFGFPPLEAMSVGTPVVGSRAGALPEVIGEAAVLVDADDPDELAAALARVLSDASVREDLVARGRRRIEHFSWVTAADQLVELYRRLA
jgi:glycosyltransferase involved in cell wall biosynthesis